MKTYAVGNYGVLSFDDKTGWPVEYERSSEADDSDNYDDIARIDVDGLRARFPEIAGDTFDVLLCGFWTWKGEYFPHEVERIGEDGGYVQAADYVLTLDNVDSPEIEPEILTVRTSALGAEHRLGELWDKVCHLPDRGWRARLTLAGSPDVIQEIS